MQQQTAIISNSHQLRPLLFAGGWQDHQGTNLGYGGPGAAASPLWVMALLPCIVKEHAAITLHLSDALLCLSACRSATAPSPAVRGRLAIDTFSGRTVPEMEWWRQQQAAAGQPVSFKGAQRTSQAAAISPLALATQHHCTADATPAPLLLYFCCSLLPRRSGCAAGVRYHQADHV